MKKILLTLLIAVLFCSLTGTAQDILWKKNYGLPTADDFGQSVIETNDGSLVVAGYTGSYGAGGFDIWLIKTDPNGDTLWTRTYGESGDDMAFVVKQTDDGGYIIAGATESFNSNGMLDGCLIKTDELGNQEWVKAYGTNSDDYFYSLEITEDGGYILAGESKDTFPVGDSDVWIIKTDSIGHIQWEKSYGIAYEYERAYSIIQTSDGGYLVGGSKGCSGFFGLESCDAWLLKLDFDGNTLWTRIYGNGYDSFRSLIQLKNLDIVMTGMKSNGPEGWNVSLLKTDSLGNEIWSKTYDYHEGPDNGYSVQQTFNGGFIVCGAGEWDVDYGWIIRTNEFGDTLWTKAVESYSINDVLSSLDTDIYSIIQLSNGDYVATGNQPYLPVSDHAQQLLLMSISSDIIPVELTSFTATALQNTVSLKWQTATETNNSGFEVQRSLIPNPFSKGEGTFQIIGFVPGIGTTTEPKSYSFVDENLSAGKYQYRLKQIDFNGTFEYSNTVEVEVSSPTEFALEQNYPNPFNPITKIKYTIPASPNPSKGGASGNLLATLKVFDVLGREVAELVNEELETGSFEKTFDASSLASGVYIYRLTGMKDGKILIDESKQMLLIK